VSNVIDLYKPKGNSRVKFLYGLLMSNFVQSRQNNAVADGHTHTRPPEYAFILSTLSEERVRTFALDNIGCQ